MVDQTPKKPEVWRINTAVPRYLKRPLRALAELRGWDQETLMAEALKALAREQNMPVTPPSQPSQWAGN